MLYGCVGGGRKRDGGEMKRMGSEGTEMRDRSPDAQINYSLHSSILSRQLPFIEPVRCPLRMAWEEKCHSWQVVRSECCTSYD